MGLAKHRRMKQPSKVLVVGFGGKPSGGSSYEDMVTECLAGRFEVTAYRLRLGARGILSYLAAPLEYIKLYRTLVSHRDYAVAIKTLATTLVEPIRQPRSIVIFHHAEIMDGLIGRRLACRLVENLRKADCVVVVADYWNLYLRERGMENVHTIRNAFRPDEFAVPSEEIRQFKERYGLVGKPIIYLGAYGKAKGNDEAFETLKHLEVHLVASGHKTSAKITPKCMYLDRREYVCLLKASSMAVTMSRFAEGWCRAAHEAMLCGTPVIGSGRGGMRELLEGGGQIICDDFDALLQDERRRMELARAGRNYAKQFTTERFQAEWVGLVSKMCAA
jgi:glycosyltransferase involved in cell wall biosynthesis